MFVFTKVFAKNFCSWDGFRERFCENVSFRKKFLFSRKFSTKICVFANVFAKPSAKNEFFNNDFKVTVFRIWIHIELAPGSGSAF
jgi:hypothetical protein